MEHIADILLGMGSMGAALFCFVLARRLKRFSTLESEMGGAIAVLSAQVDDMTRALAKAQASARENADRLEALTIRAEAAAQALNAGPQAPPPPRNDAEPDEGRRLRFVRRRAAPLDEEALA